MKILYIYAHPNSHSFNASLKQNALDFFSNSNIEFKLTDLYEEKFIADASWRDFELEQTSNTYFLAQQQAFEKNKLSPDITAEIEKVKWADHILFQFPFWWFSMPAILKGWFDRVLVKGFAYDAGKVFENGLLKEKTASLITSTQSTESAYQVNGLHGATIDAFLKPIHHTLKFVGIKPLDPLVVYAAFNLTNEQEEIIRKNQIEYLQQFRVRP